MRLSNKKLSLKVVVIIYWTDAAKSGVGAESKAASAAKQMSLDEAQKILGVDKNAPLEEVLKVSFLPTFKLLATANCLHCSPIATAQI